LADVGVLSRECLGRRGNKGAYFYHDVRVGCGNRWWLKATSAEMTKVGWFVKTGDEKANADVVGPEVAEDVSRQLARDV